LCVEGVFRHTLETVLILALASPIFVLHRLTPLYHATRRVTIIHAEKRYRTVPLGLAKHRAVRVIANAHGLEDRFVRTALLSN